MVCEIDNPLDPEVATRLLSQAPRAHLLMVANTGDRAVLYTCSQGARCFLTCRWTRSFTLSVTDCRMVCCGQIQTIDRIAADVYGPCCHQRHSAQMLADSMAADIGPSGLATFFTGATTVTLETPQEMLQAGRQGLSVWLYRVARDDQRLNDPPEVRTLPTGEAVMIPTPLPVRLHYLMTPLAPASPDTEQRILGRALQLFHRYPIVSGAFLRAELAGTNAELHVHLEALGLRRSPECGRRSKGRINCACPTKSPWRASTLVWIRCKRTWWNLCAPTMPSSWDRSPPDGA